VAVVGARREGSVVVHHGGSRFSWTWIDCSTQLMTLAADGENPSPSIVIRVDVQRSTFRFVLLNSSFFHRSCSRPIDNQGPVIDPKESLFVFLHWAQYSIQEHTSTCFIFKILSLLVFPITFDHSYIIIIILKNIIYFGMIHFITKENLIKIYNFKYLNYYFK
jgi:hypothetical protein